MSTPEHVTIANTTLAQLGGRMFLTMTGARPIAGTGGKLFLKLPRATERGINTVAIALDPSDTYTVTFSHFNAFSKGDLFRTIVEHSFVYCDQLQDIFTAETGPLTRM